MILHVPNFNLASVTNEVQKLDPRKSPKEAPKPAFWTRNLGLAGVGFFETNLERHLEIRQLHDRQLFSSMCFCRCFRTCFPCILSESFYPFLNEMVGWPSFLIRALANWDHVMNIIYHLSVFWRVKYDDISYHNASFKTASSPQFSYLRVSHRETFITRCFYTRFATIGTFAYLLGTRVGEAGHPGPKTSFAVINPAALYGKNK